MQKLATFIAILCLCVAPAFASGPTPGSLDEAVAERSCGAGKMWIPEGSNIVSTEGGSLSIEPPEGWVYVGRDADGLARAIIAGECSCTCTSSSGNCNPSIFKGDCSCTAKNGCTSCDLSTGGSAISLLESGVERLGTYADVDNGGYIDLNAGVGLTADTDLPMAFGAMFELPTVQKALGAFFDRLYPTGRAPEMVLLDDRFEAPAGYELATVNVFGRSAVVVVPQTRGRALEKAIIAGDGGSCSCSEGTCTYDSTWIPTKGTIHYCEGECGGTCTLNVTAASHNFGLERSSH